VTGLVDMSPELSAKRLQLVKEAIPKTTRVAILWNPTNPVKVADAREVHVGSARKIAQPAIPPHPCSVAELSPVLVG
jgi:hypothetical protein